MEINVVKRGERPKQAIPCYVSEGLACVSGVLKTEDGWCRGVAIEDVLVLTLSGKELGLKGGFLSDGDLSKHGYHQEGVIRSILERHLRARGTRRAQELIDSLISDLQAYNTK